MRASRHRSANSSVTLFLRLAADVNGRLRARLRYRGDLSRFISQALAMTDLMKVELLSGMTGSGSSGTTATVSVRASWRLKSAASARACSANLLVNSVLSAWLARPGSSSQL
jgi:hypothetical protein